MSFLTSPAVALLLRTTLLLGLALLAIRLLRGPAVQTLAGRAALTAVALLLLTAPLTRLVPPLWHVPAPATPRPAAPVVVLTPTAPPPQFWGAREGEEKRAGTVPAPTVPLPPPPAPRAAPVQTPSPTPPELGAGGPLLLLWATGTALLLLWLAACQIHLTQLHRRAVPLTDGPAYDTLAALTPNPPRLYAFPGIDGPFLAGILRPAIYLPADHAETFSPDALRAVLAHELAHADRRDTRWTLASRLLCALLWPQPLLWLLCRKLDHLSEDACDLAVLSHACPPRVYADCLLTLAERRPQSRRTSPLTAGLVPFRSQLARRVQHILAIQGNPPMPAVTRRLRLTIAAATLFAALGGTLLIAAPAPKESSKQADATPLSANQVLSPDPKGRPKMQTRIGYGLVLLMSKKRICFAIAGTPAARAGIPLSTPTNKRLEIVAINGHPMPTSNQSFIKLMQSGPPLRLTLKASDKPARLYILNKKETYSIPNSVSDLDVKQIEMFKLMAAQSKEKLEVHRKSLARYEAMLQEEIRKALPGSDSQTLAKAINLERNIGGFNLSIKTITEIGLQHPERKDTQSLLLARQKQLKPLLAEEARLFPATPETRQHLQKVHTLAVQCRIREVEVMTENMELSIVKRIRAETYIADRNAVTSYIYKGDKLIQTKNEASKDRSSTATISFVAAGPHRTFTINFRVPRSGTHRIQVFVTDDAGQRSVYDKIGQPGSNITVPISAEGKAITFRLYDNGKLIQTRDERIKGRSNVIKSELTNALLAQRSDRLAQRSQLASQFNDAKAHSETARVMLKVMRQQFNKRRADIKPPQLPVTQTPGKSLYARPIAPRKPMEQQFEQHVAAARNELRRRSNLPAQNPNRLAAQSYLDALLRKQAYVFAVQEYAQQWADLYNKEANTEAPLRHSLARDQNKQHHLEMEIRILDTKIEAIERQIAAVKAKKS